MKVKIFSSQSVEHLENEINRFLQDENNDLGCFHDIQYSTSESYSEAIIVYHEKLKAAE